MDASVAADTVVAERQSTIGELDGAPEQIFGRVVGVAADKDGVIYVADEIGSTVRAYETMGGYLGTVGVEGDGPGEFRYLLGLDIDPTGRLHVRGAFRVSVLERSGAAAIADSVVGIFPVQVANPDRDVRSRAGSSAFYSPSFFWEGFQRRGYFYLAYDSTGVVTDTIFVPPFPDPETTGLANYRVNERGGANVEGINRSPFEPRPTWDITREGDVWFSMGDRYEILAVGPSGDTLQMVRRSGPLALIPNDERQDSADAFQARLDSVPVSLDRVRGMSPMARRGELPSALPAIVAIQVDELGNLWVRRWPRAGVAESVFDVFGPDGSLLRTVLVPASLMTSPAPWIDGEFIVGVEQDPVTGVQRVGTFRIRASR
jgi:hypothetical protein